MELLPNNCRVGKFSVYPKNWKTKQADYTLSWNITYRFYDDNTGKVMQVRHASMNAGNSQSEKQDFTKIIIKRELDELQNGWNPITKTYFTQSEIHPYTAFIEALNYSLEKIKVVKAFKSTIKSTVKFVEISAKALRFDRLPIKEISRKHIRQILEHCEKTKKTWTAYTHNSYRKNLGILFSYLIEVEAMDHNPVTLIKKQKELKAPRKTLTIEEAEKIDKAIKKYDPCFWIFIHIFFHSGARETELLRVQGEHVDLENQTVNYQVLKGQSYVWVKRIIKDYAVPFWKYALLHCKPKEFVFGKGLKPAPVGIEIHQISKRWRTHIKKKLGITADFYSLKHLHTTQVVDLLDNKQAAKLSGHTSTRMIDDHYDTRAKQRKDENLKSLANEFGK